ncbi:MAG: methionine adenosyltransferase [Dysgonomonas sp.]
MKLNDMPLYTVESVLQGHPDKICDQISDAILDAYLEKDKNSCVAIECLGCGNNLIIAGEVSDLNLIDIENVANETYLQIGYKNKLKIKNLLTEQSNQLNKPISYGGAGDQGIMYGYAINNEFNYLPYGFYLANMIAKGVDSYRKTVDYLRPDGKIQITINQNIIENLVVSIQHIEDISPDYIRHEIARKILPGYIDTTGVNIRINENSHFINGGFSNDTGLTGRKIMVDTYGGLVTHGGGAFSGKDPSKVDRTGAYMARFVAKNIVANGFAKECKVSVAYTFGESNPAMLTISTEKEENSSKLSNFIRTKFDFRPLAIIERLELRNVRLCKLNCVRF